MGKISFKLQPRTKSGKTLTNEYGTIAIRFTNGRGGSDFLTKTPIKAKPKDWNNRLKRLKVTLAPNGATEVNEILNNMETLLVNKLSAMSITNEILNKEMLDLWVQDFFKLDEKVDRNSKSRSNPNIYILDYVKKWVEEDMESLLINGAPLKQGSKNMHTWMKNKLIAYEEANAIRTRFDKFDDREQSRMVNWLIYEHDLGLSSINQFTQILKKLIVKYAIRQGINVNPQFPSEVFMNKKVVHKKRTYLTLEDIEQISRLSLVHDPELDAARDWLLLMSNLGTSFSDAYALDYEKSFDKKKKIVSGIRVKTGTHFAVPYKDNHIVEGVLKKYNGLPSMKNVKNLGDINTDLNKKFREVCKLAGLDYLVTSVYRDDENQVTTEGEVEKYKAIYTHTCRRSFATNLYGVIPEADLLLYGGWKTPTMLNTYVKKTAFEKADMTIDRLSKVNRERSAKFLKKVS